MSIELGKKEARWGRQCSRGPTARLAAAPLLHRLISLPPPSSPRAVSGNRQRSCVTELILPGIIWDSLAAPSFVLGLIRGKKITASGASPLSLRFAATRQSFFGQIGALPSFLPP